MKKKKKDEFKQTKKNSRLRDYKEKSGYHVAVHTY